jgi:hypothetical protein
MGLPTELEESKRKILALPVYRALMAKAQPTPAHFTRYSERYRYRSELIDYDVGPAHVTDMSQHSRPQRR